MISFFKKTLIKNSIFFGFVLFLLVIPFLSAYDIDYVVQSPTNLNFNEIVIKDFLVDEGNFVSVLDASGFNANLYDVIIVSESVSDINGVFDNMNYKTLFLSRSAAKKQGLGSGSGYTSGKDIHIVDIDNIITEDFSLGDLDVYSLQDRIYYISAPFHTNSDNLAYKSRTYKSVLLVLNEDPF